MVVLRPQSDFGHAPPPQSPYSIISNLPGWDLLRGFRDGDMSALPRIVHIYPRFGPTQFAAQLGQEVAKRLGHEGKSCMLYLNPIMWSFTTGHVQNEHREEAAIGPEKLTFKCVDVAGHRLYAVLFEPMHTKALLLSWGAPGLGLSIRSAEYLLGNVDSLVQVPVDDHENPPEPTFTPDGPAHQLLRERINQLVHRAAVDPEAVKSRPGDVFLFPTGMAAVFHTTNLIQDYRPGTNVVIGVIFHNTHHHLLEESPNGFKIFGKVDEKGLDELESWLEEEARQGNKVSFVIVEFPGNPTLESTDLPRLKHLSEKHGFVLVIDDTLAGFANVDVLACSDILLTSLTKSFNGRADALGGSIVLNPLSPHYDELSSRLARSHRNELYEADAKVLLANSHDFIQRTRRLNRNAEAMATFLHRSIGRDDSPVVKVQYPTLLASKPNYDRFLRHSTAELPNPGYGCLLNVEFESVETAQAFYNRCGFYSSPHLGGHVTVMLPYNMMMFGRKPEEKETFRSFGAIEESVRISAGLEDQEDLIDTLKDALDAAVAVKKAVAPNGTK
ncbi:Cystathionine beta-lyases/cystathionine gamma-synthase [Trichoderma cornu-damae]|uniref:Cystathionine beta-lyases/cystathionine gamma-synthase n=1 Tax=Trichoderma cornu-damae TaxID=654480 RepID=A0A9P8QTI0_9HYPO|nr:Cystathionine beta-lyases/cystathionine gamma-synthase [Trichoderma cornu-damae]